MKTDKKNSKEKFPDYKHYGKEDDIYSNAIETNADVENMNRNFPETTKTEKQNTESNYIMESPVPENVLEDEEEISQSENDITKEDLVALGSNDAGDDEELKKERIYPIDMAGSDLDVPGAEDDDENEMIGEEDEENNLYSRADDQ
ncbi:MAG: hypothetical protein H7Y00_05535 [Fimbriimonadaceae bacterium]|nr:hypothetical protein [Chitinophagales bacterium]